VRAHLRRRDRAVQRRSLLDREVRSAPQPLPRPRRDLHRRAVQLHPAPGRRRVQRRRPLHHERRVRRRGRVRGRAQGLQLAARSRVRERQGIPGRLGRGDVLAARWLVRLRRAHDEVRGVVRSEDRPLHRRPLHRRHLRQAAEPVSPGGRPVHRRRVLLRADRAEDAVRRRRRLHRRRRLRWPGSLRRQGRARMRWRRRRGGGWRGRRGWRGWRNSSWRRDRRRPRGRRRSGGGRGERQRRLRRLLPRRPGRLGRKARCDRRRGGVGCFLGERRRAGRSAAPGRQRSPGPRLRLRRPVRGACSRPARGAGRAPPRPKPKPTQAFLPRNACAGEPPLTPLQPARAPRERTRPTRSA
jgi:hypothetical protein